MFNTINRLEKEEFKYKSDVPDNFRRIYEEIKERMKVTRNNTTKDNTMMESEETGEKQNIKSILKQHYKLKEIAEKKLANKPISDMLEVSEE
jgi:hypothetical protein